MDLPESFSKLCIDLDSLINRNVTDLRSLVRLDDDDLDDFIRVRSPKSVSEAFWEGVQA